MSFHGVQNDGRARKIVETLDLIHKSARSNRVGADDEYAVLKPVFDKLSEMGWHIVTSASEPESKGTRKEAPWFTVYQMAQEAELTDLTRAMAVYLNRIDEKLKE